ncbi:zinc finger protein Xfin-like [Leptidea sinapis]|uniref:zinc finger protein Xfin-like n=1 Tax=Leptidea sinapis TaxID=189913 RepID=UPI0021C2DBA0|nr:zinc finger protein Xfin-like [Leptidea sinapis]
MFIGPPKLVFIKRADGTTKAAIQQGGVSKGQTILVSPAPSTEAQSSVTPVPPTTVAVTTEDPDEPPPTRVLRRHATERKYGKRQKTDSSLEEPKVDDSSSPASKTPVQALIPEVQVKEEPEWDASSIEEEERSIAEMFQAEMSVKSEPLDDDIDVEDDGLLYSPLACELCAEVFTVPAAWVRHVQSHASNEPHRKRKLSDDSDETMALLRCDLCQKHFPNPAEWVRHIQSTHTESELAISNNSAPPKRHNRFTEGAQNKTCMQCKKIFPSHASMLIHMRTHTGERPFLCGMCNKGFNVKSNLLRHLRTLHDHVVSPAQIEDEEPGPSHVKKET